MLRSVVITAILLTAHVVAAQQTTPSASGASTPAGDVVVNVKADGTVVINRRTLSSAELSDLLKNLVHLNSEQRVIIRGDETCAYKDIVGIANICTKAGVTNMAFAIAQADVHQPEAHQPDEKKSFDKLLQEIQATTHMPNDTSNALPDKPKFGWSPLPSLPSEETQNDTSLRSSTTNSAERLESIYRNSPKNPRYSQPTLHSQFEPGAPQAILTVDQNSEIKLDGRTIAVEELEAAVRNLPETRRSSLALQVDKKASLDTIVKVMEALKLAGVRELPTFTRGDQK